MFALQSLQYTVAAVPFAALLHSQPPHVSDPLQEVTHVMSAAHEKAAEQEPQRGLPLIWIPLETKDFASSLWFVVVSSFPGFYRRVVQECDPLLTVNEERAVTFVNTCMMSKTSIHFNGIVTDMSKLIGFPCIDTNLNVW